MSNSILLTGVTGGLGAKILDDLLNEHHLNPSSIIATSRKPPNRARYEDLGLQFRVADYNEPSTLESAFQNVQHLLFMSSSERDTPTRNREHTNVVEAAKKAGVGKVWYVSLAFGGFGDGSSIGFQQAHYETENMLLSSGLDFVSLRAGVYADAFPLFLNWYPNDTKVILPALSPPVTAAHVAFASRDDLGEAIATILAHSQAESLASSFPDVKPQGQKKILLLTGLEAQTYIDLVGAIDQARPSHRKLEIEFLEPQEFVQISAQDDQGGKPVGWFETRIHFFESVIAGDGETVDPALELLLGRRPETGTEAVERLVRDAGEKGYFWHQNHMN